MDSIKFILQFVLYFYLAVHNEKTDKKRNSFTRGLVILMKRHSLAILKLWMVIQFSIELNSRHKDTKIHDRICLKQ